jgi:hypothetical protein
MGSDFVIKSLSVRRSENGVFGKASLNNLTSKESVTF